MVLLVRFKKCLEWLPLPERDAITRGTKVNPS
jgi:hypothetical protein